MTDIKNVILEKMKTGQITMRPKSYFVFRTIATILATVVVFGVVLYLVTFVFFALQRSGILFVPQFGLFGWAVLLGNIPWLLSGLTIIFLFVLEVMVHRFAIGYRTPLVYSALGLMLIVILASVVVDKTALHSQLERRVESGDLFLMRSLYKKEAFHPDFAFPGTIIATQKQTFVLQGRFGEQWTVVISPMTEIAPGVDLFVGERVMVLGRADEQIITAERIGQLPTTPPFRGHGLR